MNGFIRKSEVLYWRSGEPSRNFGDYFTELFLERALLGPRVKASRYRLVGSIIDDLNIEIDLNSISDGGNVAYWGCGGRDSSPLRPDLLSRCEFFGVRGPLTRDLLGLPPKTVLGDPGLLLPLIHPAVSAECKHGRTICVPHFHEPKTDEEIISLSGVDLVVRPLVEPSLEALEQIIDQITGATFVLAGAMHAAIVAHAYGIPFAYFDAGHLDIPFKWRDFSASIGIQSNFADNLEDGRKLYVDFIKNRSKKIQLLPILENCPYYIKPSIIVDAVNYDQSIATDKKLIKTLKNSAIESRSYVAEAQKSEENRDNRIRDYVSKLENAENEEHAQALARVNEEHAQALERVSVAFASTAAAFAAAECANLEALNQRLAREAKLAETVNFLNERAGEQDANLARVSQELATTANMVVELESQRQTILNELSQKESELAEADLTLRRRDDERLDAEARCEQLSGHAEQLSAKLAAEKERLESLLATGNEREAELSRELVAIRRRVWTEQFEAKISGTERFPLTAPSLANAVGLAANLRRARSAARRRDWRMAAKCYAQMLRIDPSQARILVQYGHALKEQGELNLAAVAYERALRLPGADLDTINHLVHVLRATGQNAEAEAVEHEFSPANIIAAALQSSHMKTTPFKLSPRLWGQLKAARIAAHAGDWPAATKAYENLIRADPGHPGLWVQLGHTLKERGALNGALSAYAFALRLNPTQADTYLQLGHVLKLLNLAPEAERAYERAFQLAPANPDARSELESLGKSDGSLIALALAAAPTRPPATRLGWLMSLKLGSARRFARQRAWASAAERYRELLSQNPGHWRIWLQLGHALKEQGNLGYAQGAYIEALAINPENADTHLQLGHILKLRGRRDDAIKAYQRAVQLAPELADARRELEAIGDNNHQWSPQGPATDNSSRPWVYQHQRVEKPVGTTEKQLGLSRREARALQELKSAMDGLVEG